MGEGGVPLHAHPARLGAGTKMVYVRDPDGIMVEVIEPAGDLALDTLLSLDTSDGASLDFTRP
jgi:hypothetical protein